MRILTMIAVTGWGQDDDKRRAQIAGFDHHLTKPVDLDVLEQLLMPIDAARMERPPVKPLAGSSPLSPHAIRTTAKVVGTVQIRPRAEALDVEAEPTALIMAAADGDLAAFEPLYRQFAPRIYGLCLRLTGQREAAEDARRNHSSRPGGRSPVSRSAAVSRPGFSALRSTRCCPGAGPAFRARGGRTGLGSA